MQDNPDQSLLVEFSLQAVENKRKSAEQGAPFYEDVEMVKIRAPGNPKTVVVARADEVHFVTHYDQQMTYAQRFEPIYNAFKAGQADFVSGTPIEHLKGLTPSKIADLKHKDVRTIQQLAGMPDTAAKGLGMGSLELIDQAKAYLEEAAEKSNVANLQAEIEALKAQIAGGAVKADDVDPFADYEDEDLRNILTEAGVKFSASEGRAKLIAKIQAERAKQAKAA